MDADTFAPGSRLRTLGRIRSLPYTVPNVLTGGVSARKGKVLAGTVSPSTFGYRMYYIGGEVKRLISGHRLVCEAFHGSQPEAKPIVRHLDGNPDNNKPSNLAWGTYRENEEDKKRHGRNPELAKTRCPRGHPYDEENTRYNQKGHRFCRTCARESSALRKARGLAPGDPRHGTPHGYLSFSCRCDPCKKAGSEYRASRKRQE